MIGAGRGFGRWIKAEWNARKMNAEQGLADLDGDGLLEEVDAFAEAADAFTAAAASQEALEIRKNAAGMSDDEAGAGVQSEDVQSEDVQSEDVQSEDVQSEEGDGSSAGLESTTGSESTVSIRGRVLTDMMSRVTNDMAIGKKIKNGEIRRRLVEPEWKVPAPFNMTHYDLDGFSMKLLSSKENPDMSRIILQLHGGGYIGAVRNTYYVFAGLYNELSKGLCVVTPDYRVAPEHPFPAALEDALATYQWILKSGWTSKQIILAGDSAGGGLAMALTMYLRDHHMPMPAGIVAMSPWTDLTASGESYDSNYEKDPMFGNTRDSMIYLNDYYGDQDPANPYISPKFGDFTGFPPMLIQAGSLEMLLSDSVDVAAKARAAGVKVRLHVYEGMFHVFQMAYTAIPESKNAWTEVGKFLEIIK